MPPLSSPSRGPLRSPLFGPLAGPWGEDDDEGGGGTAPTFGETPTITGIPSLGSVLACSDGLPQGSPTPTVSYQWRRDDGTNIGTDSPTYTPVAGDEGFDIDCVVTASNGVNPDATATAADVGPITGTVDLYYLPHYGQSLSIGGASDGAPVSLTGSAVTITGATQADPVVITAASHGFSNGDEVLIDGVVGMTELNGKTLQVQNITPSTFELYKIDGEETSLVTEDGTGFTAYTSGGTAQETEASSVHLMFNGGTRPNYDDLDSLGNPNGAIYYDAVERLIPSRERARYDGVTMGETLQTGVGKQCTIYKLLQTSTGRGAYRIGQLQLDGDEGTSTTGLHFQNTATALLRAYDLGVAGGYTMHLAPMIWKHGEADAAAGTTKSAYKDDMDQLQADFLRIKNQLWGTSDTVFKMIGDQVGGNDTGNGEIAVAMIELHREDAGIICLGPTYDYEYKAVNDPHLSPGGYRDVGEKYGKAIEHILDGNTWDPCHITAASRSTTTITLTIHVPEGALVKDTTNVTAVADDGFTYTGANITAVTITDTGATDNIGTIEITIDADAGGTLRYAYENGTTLNYGPTTGPRGNIRDSSTSTTDYSSKALYNWLCVDDWTIA